MSSTDQNNWNDFARSINELESSPVAGSADMSQAWQKLEKRLDNRRSKPVIPWRWLAAAAVAVLIVSVMLLRPNHEEQVTGIVDQSPAVLLAPRAINAPRKVEVPHDGLASATVTKIAPLKLLRPAAKANLVHHTITQPPTEGITEPLIVADNMTDTMASATVVPVRKSLRIIHNNLLNNKAPVVPDYMARVTVTEKSVPGWQFSHNASDNILQIKISSTQ